MATGVLIPPPWLKVLHQISSTPVSLLLHSKKKVREQKRLQMGCWMIKKKLQLGCWMIRPAGLATTRGLRIGVEGTHHPELPHITPLNHPSSHKPPTFWEKL